ncbi:MAG TPA: hypothetical protein VLQ48_14680, partial [Chloroflexia bacterium]|nr:hypothetical protein [Chloroflexia bacterium]
MQNTGIGLVLLGLVFGALVWILIVWYKPAISVRQILRLVILTGLFGHLILAFVTPTFFAPDEQPHFKYVQYLAVHTSFPIQDSATDAPTNDWEYYQPPIYYIVSVPIYWLVDGLSDGNVYVTVRALRLFSIALWGVTLWITLLVLSR